MRQTKPSRALLVVSVAARTITLNGPRDLVEGEAGTYHAALRGPRVAKQKVLVYRGPGPDALTPYREVETNDQGIAEFTASSSLVSNFTLRSYWDVDGTSRSTSLTRSATTSW